MRTLQEASRKRGIFLPFVQIYVKIFILSCIIAQGTVLHYGSYLIPFTYYFKLQRLSRQHLNSRKIH